MTFQDLIYGVDIWIEGLDYIDYVLIIFGFVMIASAVALILDRRRSKNQ